MKNLWSFFALLVTLLIETIVITYVKRHSYESNKQLIKSFTYIVTCMIGWQLGLIIQLLVVNYISEGLAQYIDYYLVYPFIILMPLSLFFFAYKFKNRQMLFQRWFLLLFIVPVIIMLVIFTNDFHHLFYEIYSTDISTTKFGPFSTVHTLYTYITIAIALVWILKRSIKDTSIVSIQTILIILAILIPIFINISGLLNIFPVSIYVTPISFSISIIFLRNCNI